MKSRIVPMLLLAAAAAFSAGASLAAVTLNVTPGSIDTHEAGEVRLYRSSGRGGPTTLLAQIESFVTTNGEIVIFDDQALPFAEELGGALEKQLGVKEAVLRRRPPPS